MRKWTSKYAVKEKNPMSSNQTPLPKSKTSVWTRRFRELVSAFGLRGVAEYLLWSKVSRRMFPASRARHPLALHPLWCRWGGSDYFVFNQIFRHPEYACVAGLPRVELVIDCGANAGYSAAYFLSRYPQCRLIAVEPEPGNFALLQRNLAPYGERAKPVHAGVWSHTADLVLVQEKYGDGLKWSKQVRPCREGEKADFKGVDIGSLLDSSGFDRISLLKVDVEGAEAVIFGENFEAWLDRVDAIAIELHDDSMFGQATDVFHAAIQDRGFQVSHSGQLTVCRRPRLSPAIERPASFSRLTAAQSVSEGKP